MGMCSRDDLVSSNAYRTLTELAVYYAPKFLPICSTTVSKWYVLYDFIYLMMSFIS